MNAIIAYNTVTGNTEICTDWIRECLIEAGHQVQLKDPADMQPEELLKYDLIILGSPTYWEGDVTDEFAMFLEEMASLDLKNKKAAAFGLGDSEMYPEEFCLSANILEASLKKCGATLVTRCLKIDGDPDEQEDAIRLWAKQLAERV